MRSAAQPLREMLDRYRPCGQAEAADVERIRAMLRVTDDPWRRTIPLHLTASALVVHPGSAEVLLRWHERQQAWLQVGGHGDPGESDPLAIALREAREETGLADLVPWPDAEIRQVVIVSVPASATEPAHEHADVRYLLATTTPRAARAEQPGAPLRWLTMDGARQATSEANLREMFRRVEPLLGGLGGAAPPGSAGLSDILARAAAGRPPPPDGRVTVVAQPSARDAGVIAFTAHSVVFADVVQEWVHSRLRPDDLSAPLSPPFLHELGEHLGRRARSIDMLTVAPALPGPPPMRLAEISGSGHPRVRRAHDYRDDLTVWGGEGAVIMIGRGVAGRSEVGIEVDPARRGRGIGRAAALAARHLAPGGQPLWAQIAPGNAASVRAFLAAGFVPAGAESLLVRS